MNLSRNISYKAKPQLCSSKNVCYKNVCYKKFSHSKKHAMACLMLVASAMLSFSQMARANDKLVEIESGSVNALSIGKGKYTIIFEAGFGSDMMHWRKVAPAISQKNTIFAYSRLGSGKSSKPEKARQLFEAIGDFEAVVAAEDLKPPFIMVSHSFGAMIARGYAEKHPDNVAGMIFVDPYDPTFIKELKQLAPAETQAFLGAFQKMLPPHLMAEQSVLTNLEEKGVMPKFGTLPDVPAVVLTSVKQEHPQFVIHSVQGKRIWRKLHSRWFNHFSNGRHEITTLSGHNIALEQPEMVIESIAYVVAQADIKAQLEIKEKALELAAKFVSNAQYDQAGSTIFTWLVDSNMDSEQINTLGYKLLNSKQYWLSALALKFNVMQNPTSANVYDSYGEALMALSQIPQAKQQFEMALKLAKGQGKSPKAIEGYLRNLEKANSLIH